MSKHADSFLSHCNYKYPHGANTAEEWEIFAEADQAKRALHVKEDVAMDTQDSYSTNASDAESQSSDAACQSSDAACQSSDAACQSSDAACQSSDSSSEVDTCEEVISLDEQPSDWVEKPLDEKARVRFEAERKDLQQNLAEMQDMHCRAEKACRELEHELSHLKGRLID
ncbi:hypothetical protein BDR07DRAFT_1495255 [Suillus spraguei]|nr:hypothetical protein BDR07DRAFT_1495255 [Suillus spraguei]